MPKVWLAIPAARDEGAGSTVHLWREKGYGIALFREDFRPPIKADICVNTLSYCGYARTVNFLAKLVLEEDSDCDFIVAGGDDTDPDRHDPEQIARECTEHFGQYLGGFTQPRGELRTFGVMQPTGDRWGDSEWARRTWPEAPAYIDRIAGSPWLGRAWCTRVNGGKGPLWPEYVHMFVDEELQHVAKLLGVFWQRQDLTHFHHHISRKGDRVDWAQGRRVMPDFLVEPNTSAHWQKYRDLFMARKSAGFPGHEPT